MSRSSSSNNNNKTRHPWWIPLVLWILDGTCTGTTRLRRFFFGSGSVFGAALTVRTECVGSIPYPAVGDSIRPGAGCPIRPGERPAGSPVSVETPKSAFLKRTTTATDPKEQQQQQQQKHAMKPVLFACMTRQRSATLVQQRNGAPHTHTHGHQSGMLHLVAVVVVVVIVVGVCRMSRRVFVGFGK